ncbi:Creatinine amidohydrolase [hydrothermal vent metagenome]|uniref:Creatinine amidohydrolase n=1 Tax=hydrothermal vent metagenome TaxID=652676 RepID=A0A3B0YQX3_9ZZZZ
MILQTSTWQEVEHYLKTSTGIIVPIGSTEQHGPNGLIGTDAICPKVIAYKASELAGMMVAPTVNYGNAHHHLGFPGTIAIRPSTLLAMICDIVESLALHGFQHIYFLNGHGGNSATVTAAFAEYYATRSFNPEKTTTPLVHTTLMNWWYLSSLGALSKEFYGDREGSHATPSEVSLSYFAHPEAVKTMPHSEKLPPSGPIYDASDFRSRYADGRMGSDPSMASVEHGEKILSGAAKDVVASYQRFVDQN